MNSHARLGLLPLVVPLLALIGCGPSPTEDGVQQELNALRAENARLREELKGAGPLIQTGKLEARTGEMAISYPREYVAPPKLRFPQMPNVRVHFRVEKETGSGCILSVSSVGIDNDAPKVFEWIAEGEARR